MSAWDVVVVGGGPAGASAARSAVRAGARVLLLEREALPVRRVCGEYVCPGAAAELRALGFGPALGAARTRPLAGMRLYSPRGRQVVTNFPAGSPGLSVRRCELDPLLVADCGAAVRRGARVLSLDVGRHGVQVGLADGSRVETAAVIGADGRGSTVARQAGLHRPTPARRAVLHAYFSHVAGTSDHGEMHLPGDGSYFGLNPGPDGHVNVSYVTDLDRLAGGAGSRARAMLREALSGCVTLRDRFANARCESEVKVLARLEVRARRVAADRVLLAGDAAGFLDPLTGEGMYGAVVSGRLAGDWAARAVRENRTAGSFLRGYARAHRRALGRKLPLNRGFQWLLQHPRVLEFLGGRLAASRRLGDVLIGVIGNVRRPRELLRPRQLATLAGLWT